MSLASAPHQKQLVQQTQLDRPTTDKSRLVGELWGGITAALVALPSAIAFGVTIFSPLGGDTALSQGALAGILGAIALGLTAPFLGGAPRLITAPCAPAAAILSGLVGQLMLKKPGATENATAQEIILLLTLVCLMCGALQFVYGALRAGQLIKYIPYPVVSGYLSGVGLIILLGQLPKFLGIKKEELFSGLISPDQWKWPGVIVGTITIVGMLVSPKLTKKIPAAVIALALGIAAYFGLGYFQPELLQLNSKFIIGSISGADGFWPAFRDRWTALGALSLSDLQPLLIPAVTLSVLLSIDTLKTCVVMDALTRSRHNSNRELFGQGIANMASAVIGGIPGAGTMGPTLVNVNSGGKTALSSFIEGLCVLIAFVLFSKIIAWVPIAALAGILIVIACRMIDRHSWHLLKNKSTILDFFVILVVVAVAQFDLIAAAGAGLALAILLFIREFIRGSVVRRKTYASQVSSKRARLPAEKEYLQNYGTAVSICELQGSLFFGTTDQLFTRLEPDLKLSRYVILDMRRVQSADFTAVHMLEQIESILSERHGHLIFSSLPTTVPNRQDLRQYFSQLGLIQSKPNVKVFDSLDAALEWAEDRVLEERKLPAEDQEKALDLPEIELLQELEDPSIFTALKACVKEKSFAEGETIFMKGDCGDELFLIRCGVVHIHLPLEGGRKYNLATFARGNFFGDMAFLDRTARSADAVAAVPTELFVISRKDFDTFLGAHPETRANVFARLAHALAVRLRYTTNEVRALQES